MDNRIASCLAIAAATLVTASAAPLDYDPFPAYETIPPSERLPFEKGAPANRGFVIAKDGSLEVNGVPRYFPATLWYGGAEWSLTQKREGHPLDWFYKGLPNYEDCQRLGLDAGGFSGPLAWMKKLYRPSMGNEPRNAALIATVATNGLSMYVDITASEWSHGSMWHSDIPLDPDRKVDPPKCKKDPKLADSFCNHSECGKLGDPGRLSNDAWTQGHHHWVPYSIVHPQGRGVWKHMWEEVVKGCMDFSYEVEDPATHEKKTIRTGVHPWCYELFNEPSCWDESPYAKQCFAEKMKARYGSIEKLNRAWAASEAGARQFESFEALATAYGDAKNPTAFLVEYTKFIETCFASLLEEGAAIVAKTDRGALATFQPCMTRTRGLDLYRCYKPLGVVCSRTNGGGSLDAHLLRALADGKPIVDNEMYIGQTFGSIRGAYLAQYQRGFNISYSFKWDGRKSAYNFMNPDNVAADALLAVRASKREILDVNAFFTPRNRGLYLWRWQNPHPEKSIAAIDIVSANGDQIPLIAAISVEE